MRSHRSVSGDGVSTAVKIKSIGEVIYLAFDILRNLFETLENGKFHFTNVALCKIGNREFISGCVSLLALVF